MGKDWDGIGGCTKGVVEGGGKEGRVKVDVEMRVVEVLEVEGMVVEVVQGVEVGKEEVLRIVVVSC